MAFKVPYKTRVKLQRAIQQQIKNLGLVQDWVMYESIRVGAATADLNKIYVTVNAIYYYYFQDNGTQFIAPNSITQKALESSKGREFVSETMTLYYEYLFKTYPILENTSKLNVTPDIIISYNLYGSPNGEYDGIFEEYIKLFPI